MLASSTETQRVAYVSEGMDIEAPKDPTEHLGNVSQLATIHGTKPCYLHSNGRELRVAPYIVNKFWKVDLHSLGKPQLVSLDKKVTAWRKAFWHDTAVALMQYQFEEEDSYTITGSTITLFSTETGDKLADLKINKPELSAFWYQDSLLLQKPDSSTVTLYSWDTAKEGLTRIFDSQLPLGYFSPTVQASNIGGIYCLQKRNRFFESDTPFFRVDLEGSKLSLLNYTRKFSADIENFHVVDPGYLLFSNKNVISLLDAKNSELICNLETPFAHCPVTSVSPSGIACEPPLVACFSEHRFLVYDIRRSDKALYDHDYLTLRRQISEYTSLSTYLPFHVAYADLKIQSIALSNFKFFVAKRDESIDCFDLASAPTPSYWDSFSGWLKG